MSDLVTPAVQNSFKFRMIDRTLCVPVFFIKFYIQTIMCMQQSDVKQWCTILHILTLNLLNYMKCSSLTTVPCPDCVVNERADAPQWAG